MVKIVVIIIIIIIIGIIITQKEDHRANCSNKSNSFRRNESINNNVIKTINDCYSSEDIQYKMSNYENQLVNEIDGMRKNIDNAKKLSNDRIKTYWLDSYKQVLSISNMLEKNLQEQKNRLLSSAKFQYYVNLHFRSMIAADITYKEYKSVDESFREINQLLLSIKNGKIKVNRDTKNELFRVKDKTKELHNILLNRVHQLNRQTEEFKKKIGSECGERGKRWQAERERNKKL